ncbi:LLM class flavin-dependent oxidoreductase [Streptomyces sp. HC307]|uniref:LLM class flavin-dependent oxidoreductase n=1 Tax=Streptomyces flavusporus TaxID=3385496 RepID=UPI0039175D29
MKTGLGLPIDHKADLMTWARRADASPFSTLALADRLVYDNPDTLLTLSAVAAVTNRIRVQSEVLLVPNYNTAILAKQTATLDRLSGGRFTLGIGVGVREDDFLAAGVGMRRRGSRLNEQMELLRRTWAGQPYGEGIGPVGPPPVSPGGPEVLFGGFVPAMIDRVGRWGDGFLGAGVPAAGMDALFRDVEKAWDKHGRSGRPRLVAQANAALGDASVIAEAQADIRRYYTGVGLADQQAAGMLTTEKTIRDAVAAFAGIGADEVILYCWASDPDQIDRFADVVFG